MSSLTFPSLSTPILDVRMFILSNLFKFLFTKRGKASNKIFPFISGASYRSNFFKDYRGVRKSTCSWESCRCTTGLSRICSGHFLFAGARLAFSFRNNCFLLQNICFLLQNICFPKYLLSKLISFAFQICISKVHSKLFTFETDFSISNLHFKTYMWKWPTLGYIWITYRDSI